MLELPHNMVDISATSSFIKSLLGFDGSFSQEYIEKHQKEVELIEWYRGLNKVYFEIFEAVFHNYRNNEPYVIPDYWLNLSFSKLINILKELQQMPILKNLPHFDFDDCVSLTVNYEQMIKDYPLNRQRMLDYRSRIEQLFYLKNKGVEGNLSEDLEQDLKYYDELIQKHKEKRGLKYETVVQNTLKFYHHKSAKKSVYKILERHKNEWINKRKIQKELSITYDDFRYAIHQLRNDIVKQKLSEKIIIENNHRNGEYKLTVLA